MAVSQTFNPLAPLSYQQPASESGSLVRVLQTLTTDAYNPPVIHLGQAGVELNPAYIVRHPLDSGAYVTSEWTTSRCDVENVYSGCYPHSGIDFGTHRQTGWAVYPTARGVVTYVGSYGGGRPACGHYLAVYHMDYDLTTLYCHLARTPHVSLGEYVTPQTVIGEVGTSGLSNGIHLHFMTVWGSSPWGEHFDPRHWFNQQNIEV